MSEYQSENVSLKKGNCLYVEGDSPDAIFQLRQGELEITRNADSITILEDRGDPIGFSEAALGLPRLTTVRAVNDCLLKRYQLTGDDVHDWINEHPLTGLRIMRNNAFLLDYLNQTNKELFDLFHESRNTFEKLLEPMSTILTEMTHDYNSLPEDVFETFKNALDNFMLKSLVRNYRTVVNSTGRSVKQAPSDLSVPETVQETFDSGTEICKEDTEDDSFYILLEGSLSVLKKGQRVASMDEPGSIFGEMAALLDGERIATIQADTESRVAVLPYDRIRDHFEENTELSQTMFKTFLKRLRKSVTLNNSLKTFLKRVREMRDQGEIPQTTRKKLRQIIDSIEEHVEDDHYLNEAGDRMDDFLEEGIQTEFRSKF
jgi:CRP-like cAMP-binding protein